jgi:hypothetical protein
VPISPLVRYFRVSGIIPNRGAGSRSGHSVVYSRRRVALATMTVPLLFSRITSGKSVLAG